MRPPSRSLCRRTGRNAGLECRRVSLEVGADELDARPSPELLLGRSRIRRDRPRRVREWAVGADAAQDEPETPVPHRVPDEEEVAAPERRREADGDPAGDIRGAQVVEVAVLGDDEALPVASRPRVDAAAE